ncbi:hypothetical protein RhiJN_10866 [Ceratobasidium sp. AG-Ba]|nr:hypothetical protein RhiJN_10866 [Ceratobasidium sp. AG-Ba]
MIVSESQRDDSKSSIAGDDGSVAASGVPSNPPPYSSSSSAGASSTPNPVPQPRCNYLLNHQSNGSVKGTWHVDTTLAIPESILPPITDFDGRWNEDVKKARKRKTPFPSEVRPNLMLMSDYGSVNADVHILPSNRGPALIVAESKNGSVDLVVDVPPEQVSKIHANAAYGEVKVWIPSTFQGALTIGTSYGDLKISDGVKAKLTTFYSKSNRSRSFIGDWQSAGFGTTQPATNDSKSPVTDDPFTSWPGSTIRIDSSHGSVSLGLIEEKPLPKPESDEPNPFKAFWGGLFGKSVCPSSSGADVPQNVAVSSNEPVDHWPLDRKQQPPPPSET